MRVRLLSFAGVREILGSTEQVVELEEGATLADLQAVLDQSYPQLAPYWERLAVAIDGRISGPGAKLYEGAEVALLPPVSGGDAASEGDLPLLVEQPIDVGAVVARVAARGRGAVLTFQGTVRDGRERRVTHLHYDAYRPMATRALERITHELESADEDLAVEIVHRLGVVPAGETSVVIAVASPHRDAAYRASREALERLKREVPIWKREHFADGEARWREEEPLKPIPEPAATT